MNLRSIVLTAPQSNTHEITDATSVIFAGFVNEAITVQATAPIGAITGAVVSAPGGSGATWSGATFTPDLVGEYVLTAANGLATPAMKFTLRVLPAEALDARVVADPFWHLVGSSCVSTAPLRSAQERREILVKMLRGDYGAVSAATLAALTAQAPVPSGLSFPRR